MLSGEMQSKTVWIQCVIWRSGNFTRFSWLENEVAKRIWCVGQCRAVRTFLHRLPILSAWPFKPSSCTWSTTSSIQREIYKASFFLLSPWLSSPNPLVPAMNWYVTTHTAISGRLSLLHSPPGMSWEGAELWWLSASVSAGASPTVP